MYPMLSSHRTTLSMFWTSVEHISNAILTLRMSWTAYTDALVANPDVSGAVICGYPDGSLYCMCVHVCNVRRYVCVHACVCASGAVIYNEDFLITDGS
jgi:hypothetical protein